MSNEPGVPAGWYADERNRQRERYWSGTDWVGRDRWRRGDTPQFPAGAPGTPGPPGLQASPPWAVVIVMIACLWAIGSIIVGAVLISHTGQRCDSVCSTTHPHGGLGAVVIVGGLLLAAFMASFAAVHRQLETLRLQLLHITEKLDSSA